MKQFGHRHQSLRRAHRGVLGRGGWQQRRTPQLLPEDGIHSASPPVNFGPPISFPPTPIREVKWTEVRAPRPKGARNLFRRNLARQTRLENISSRLCLRTFLRTEVSAPFFAAMAPPSSADFQSAVSQVSNLPRVGSIKDGAPCQTPPVDWKSATQQIGNLPYDSTVHANRPRRETADANRALRARLASLAQRHAGVRVVLHVLAFIRSRRNFRWHLNCIGHEFYDRRRRK